MGMKLICVFLHFQHFYGEKIVVRILDRVDHTMALEKLGFDASMCAL